jgi:Tol biopolymer transport system component
VTDFAISPDGRTVVYRANASGAPQFDLFSVPIQGHRAVRRSTGEAGGGVARLTQVANNRQVATDFRFSFDGKQVLYRANVTRANTFDVFRVAVGGRSAPVRVSTVPADRTTTSFALGPDQSRVVYIANSLLPGTFELFSVALGGGPAVRLDPKIALLGGSGDVSSFRIDVHSRRVVYLADRDVDELRELFAVPIDGSAPAERLNRPLPANGDVESDYALLPGGRVLYRADQEKNDVLELFVSLERPVLPR